MCGVTAPAGGKPGPRLEPDRPGCEVPRINQAKTPAEDCRLWAIPKRRREPRLRGETLPRGVWRETSAVGFRHVKRNSSTAGAYGDRAAVHTSMRDGDRSRGSASRVPGPRTTIIPGTLPSGPARVRPLPPRAVRVAGPDPNEPRATALVHAPRKVPRDEGEGQGDRVLASGLPSSSTDRRSDSRARRISSRWACPGCVMHV